MHRTILLCLLPVAACRFVGVIYSTDLDTCHMFGDRLDAARGARLLCWPADAFGSRFRCVEDRVDLKIGEQPVRIWPSDERLPGSAGSVIVILPPDASAELRSRASTLAEDLTRGAPRAGRHFVTAASSWEEITGGRELAGRLQELHAEAAERRSTESDDGIFATWRDLNGMIPDVVVVVLEGNEDRWLVLEGVCRTSPFLDGWHVETQTFMSSAAIRDLPPPVTRDGDPSVMVFQIVVPRQAGGEARERAARLAIDLLARTGTSVYMEANEHPDVARGVVRPGDFQPPYICPGLPFSTKSDR